jgi:hypothetical protein
MEVNEQGMWAVPFNGDMILDRKFWRGLNAWLYDNGSGRRFINRQTATAFFAEETDALLCLMAYR